MNQTETEQISARLVYPSTAFCRGLLFFTTTPMLLARATSSIFLFLPTALLACFCSLLRAVAPGSSRAFTVQAEVSANLIINTAWRTQACTCLIMIVNCANMSRSPFHSKKPGYLFATMA